MAHGRLVLLEDAETRPQDSPSQVGYEGPRTYLFMDVGSSFDALAEARYEYVQAKFTGVVPPDVEESYRRTLRAFQQMHGRIVHEYWTSSVAGGVVVTVTRPVVRFRPSRAHFHRFTDYLSRSFPDAGELLFAGDALAAICEEVLRGPTQRIALTQVYTAASQLLSSLDALAMGESYASTESWVGPPDDGASAITAEEAQRRERARAEERARLQLEREQMERERERRLRRSQVAYQKSLARADRFYRTGAGQSAQFYYFKGMLIGAAVVATLVFGFTQMLPLLADLWGLDLSERETAAGFAAATAGSLGASVSVMWRMTAGTFREDAVFGADNLVRLGAFRPFLGSMFGLILFVALQADFLSETYIPENPGWYFYIFLAFLAGFSERLVPDFLGDSERGLSRREAPREEEQEVASAAVPTEESRSAPVITA